ncbi:hypothetical protein [Curtobacterium sp. Leaf261]|uniref:hypothetical protein n=1 Tax=Curtobacterium sp. Leaf261 TaxID=1736311 RepID=UPI0006F7408F|nr:hypothetical protein [Curtobacterium sp. Leaf261]KQO64863.1 hypothetical protein ASF23_01385 [Curtobacterium sp. Leaf261]
MSDVEQPQPKPRPPRSTAAPRQEGSQQEGSQQDQVDDTVLGGDLTRPVSHDAMSGERDYVATNAGGVSAEPGNPLPEDEQGRGTEYDPEHDGPQQEG